MSGPQLEFSPLLDWVEGRLSPQAAQDMELLLGGTDESTRALVAWLRNFHSARRAVRIAEPPPELRALLKARFAAHRAARNAQVQPERLVAALSFDSVTRPAAAFGARTAAVRAAQRRQLVFSCAVADIALTLHRRLYDAQLDLSGQIFPHGNITASGWGVLLIGDQGPDATQTDELGEFSFEEVAPGDYTISIETNHLAITMPMVPLVP